MMVPLLAGCSDTIPIVLDGCEEADVVSVITTISVVGQLV